MRSEIESAAEEQDACAIIFEAAEAAGVGFECLDLGVKALGERIGDTVLEVGEQAVEMCFERLGYLLHFRQATAHDTAIPFLKEDLAGFSVGFVPELDHLLFIKPCLGGAKVAFQQGFKVVLVFVRNGAV